jgi:hypothetical protein
MTEFWKRAAASLVGCLLALIALRAWDAYGWSALLGVAVLALGLLAFARIKRRWDGNRGLNQWPHPHGKFYSEWMALPIQQTTADYYDWLSEKMGHREPWNSWAAMDREIQNQRQPDE